MIGFQFRVPKCVIFWTPSQNLSELLPLLSALGRIPSSPSKCDNHHISKNSIIPNQVSLVSIPIVIFSANRLQEPRRAEQGAGEGGGRPARAQLGHPAALHHRQHLQDDRDRLPHLGQQGKAADGIPENLALY